MSNQVLAQSATQLTVSNNGEWTDEQFLDAARRASIQNASGLVLEKKVLNWNKLVSKVCADYRDHFCSRFEKGERLPSEIFEKIQDAVSTVIKENMNVVTAQNIISMKRSAAHVSSDMKFVERVTMTGENVMGIKEQHLFCKIAIREANEKLTKLQNKPTPNHEAEAKQHTIISKLEATLAHIEKTMAAKTT